MATMQQEERIIKHQHKYYFTHQIQHKYQFTHQTIVHDVVSSNIKTSRRALVKSTLEAREIQTEVTIHVLSMGFRLRPNWRR